MNNKLNLVELIKYIDPSRLDYQEWINVGMALKQEGYSEYDWDSWSSRDSSRYHSGECHKKWATFNGSSSPVTGGTIYQTVTITQKVIKVLRSLWTEPQAVVFLLVTLMPC